MRAGTLFDSTRYKRFINERDVSLERILTHAQVDLSRMLFDSLSQIEGVVASLALRTNQNVLATFSLSHALEQQSLEIFSKALYPMVDRIERMRKASFTLFTPLGELEAIGQSTKRVKQQTSFDFKQKLKRQQKKSTLIGNDLTSRVWLSLMQVRSSILDAFRLALVQKLDAEKILAKILMHFQKPKSIRSPPVL